jgi:hypothetical protein
VAIGNQVKRTHSAMRLASNLPLGLVGQIFD